MKRVTIQQLRTRAVGGSLFAPLTLAGAVRQLGFVQADPIRAPARAQDLILRHRVKGYRVDDLERRYHTMAMEEDVLYAYGFLPRGVWGLLHAPQPDGVAGLDAEVLAAVRQLGDTHPRQLDAQFGRKRVKNAWGGFSQATKRSLERLHRRGLVRVARRENGIRVYQPAPPAVSTAPSRQRFRELLLVAVGIFAPAAETRLSATLAPVRRRMKVSPAVTRALIDELVAEGALVRANVDGVRYVWPAQAEAPRRPGRAVRFLAPFDPLVWDRERFEQLWGWAYRFEAYTPAAKRVRGYYALPMLWHDAVIGWANVSTNGGELDVDVGFATTRPRGKAFSQALDAEVERMRQFLRPRRTRARGD